MIKFVILAASLSVFGCRQTGEMDPMPRVPPESEAIMVDTLRGTVAVVGSEPASLVVLRPATGGREIRLDGSYGSALERLSGIDVWVSGELEVGQQRLIVSRFEVRSVDGVPARDGVLAVEGVRLVLVTPDGRRLPISNPPDALFEHVGGRVWVSGPPDREPVAFGLITPPAESLSASGESRDRPRSQRVRVTWEGWR